MANSKQAKKRAEQSEIFRQRNVEVRSRLRTFIKKVLMAIKSGNKEQAKIEYNQAVPVIDSNARKGIIHPNKAARHKSRLSARIKEMVS